MRILRLGLEKYGQFAGAELALATDDAAHGRLGLTVVHGPNEAGKTTLLHAVRDLLFGFPNVTPYSFRFESPTLALDASLALADGTLLDVRRKKARGETLHGKNRKTGAEIDGAWLSARLGAPTRPLFENVFGFSHAELARGGEMLKSEDASTALYGSGFGGARPDDLRKELDQLASGLFTDRGKNPTLNASARKLAELRKGLRDITVRGADYEKQRQLAVSAKAEADAAHAELLTARRDLERLHALEKGTAAYRELRAAKDELAGIHAPDALQRGSREALVRLRADREARARELRDAEDEVGRAESELAALHVDDVLMRSSARIEELYRRVASYEKSLADLPKRESELRELRRALGARLTEVRPDWTLAMLRDVRLDAAARSELDAACAAYERSMTLREQLTGARSAALAEMERATPAAATEPAPGDMATVRTLLAEWSAFAADRDRIAAAEKRAAACARQCDALRRKLDPPLAPGGADPALLPVLRPEEIREFARQLDVASHAAAAAREARDAARAKRDQLDGELAGLDAGGAVPTEEALAEARARRDHGYRLVVRAFRDGVDVTGEARAFDGERPLSEAYERAVRTADDIADAMRRASGVVERRSLRARERREVSERLVELARHADATDARGGEIAAAWELAWKRAGFVPLTPAAMLAWCADREQLLAAADAKRSADDELRALREATSAYVRALSHALGARGALEPDALGAPGALDPNVLRARAAAAVAAADRHAERQKDLAAAQQRRDDADRKIQAIDAELATWRALWTGRLAALGLEPTLSVPAARAVVEGLVDMRAELARETAFEERIAKIAADIAAFERDARAAADDLGRELANGPVAALVEVLHADLAQSRTTLAKREASSRALARSLAVRSDRARALEVVTTALADLATRAAARDDDDLDALVARAERRDELTARIAQHERDLRHAQGPFESFEAYVATLAGTDDSVVREEIARREAKAEILSGRVRELDARGGSAEEAFSRIDGGSAAADLSSALEEETAAFGAAARRYAVHTLAHALLTDAIARFEREHQPAILGAASALFGAMTGGRYTRVFRRLADGVLLVERGDGHGLTPDKLSTGTREQMYLAMRLAYIQDYGARVEPLPVILDDVLVNFDEERARATLRVLAALGASMQVVLFTCHGSMVALSSEAAPGLTTVAVPPASDALHAPRP